MSEVICLTTGPYKANCYILHAAGQAVVLDPGAEAERILAAIDAAGVVPLAVVCTHGHIDHIGAVAAVKRAFDCPAYIHGADRALVRRAHLYAAFFKASGKIEIPDFEGDLRDHLADGLTIGPFAFSVIETPGHSDGGVCLVSEDRVFTGDTLFAKGHGGVKLPGGNPEKFRGSIAAMQTLDPALTIYPGHGKTAVLEEALTRVDTIDA